MTTTIDIPNLDALTTDDLHTFIAETRGLRPRRAARRLFGDSGHGHTAITRDLHHYAWNVVTERACRLRGDIATAEHYRAICDRIYDSLPDYARW